MMVTGFGAFRDVENNPSAELARSCGRPYEVLEVSFCAVDDFVGQLDQDSFDAWLMLGVHGKSDLVRLEAVAKNWVGVSADVLGEVRGPGVVDPRYPAQVHGRLWEGVLPPEGSEIAWDAGGYLCNYLYFRGVTAFPGKKVGFLHVCLESAVPLGVQAGVVSRLIEGIEG